MTEPRQVLYTPVDPDDATFEDLNREPTEDEIEFEKFKEEFKQSNEYAKVSCYRQPTTSDGRPGMKQLTFLFEAGVEEFSFSQLAGRLRDEYGTGTYRIQLRDKDNKMRMNRGVSIEAPKLQGDETNPQNIIEIVSRVMQEQQVRTENMFKQLQGPQTSGDAIDQIVKIAGAVAPILTALGISRPDPAPAPKTLIEQLTEMKLVQEMLGGNDSGGMGGEANLYSLLSETVKAFGGPIAEAIAAGAESGELTPQGLAALPAPDTRVGDTSVQPTGAEAMTEQEKHNMAMRKNIHILIQNANAKVPAEAFAMVLVNNTPEEKADELFDFISAENCVEIIIKLEPAAEPFKQWFVDLRIAVIDLMTEPEPEIEPDGQELQDDPGESNLADSESVAGDTEGASPEDSESSGTSDGDTSGDT